MFFIITDFIKHFIYFETTIYSQDMYSYTITIQPYYSTQEQLDDLV
jgi:hypothetical protein